MAVGQRLNRSRVNTRFKLSKYCPRTEPGIENCDSPTLRFGEPVYFSVSFAPSNSAAWPAAFQIMFKNNAEFSLLELLRDVFSKRFQGGILCHLNDNG
jgi:hypothetical protein